MSAELEKEATASEKTSVTVAVSPVMSAVSERVKELTEGAVVSSEEELSEEETVKEVIVREPLNFFSDFSVAIVLETLIVQSAYVPTLKVFKVMVLLPVVAMVVLEEHEPP
jgi:hypothetical protein